jgi:hypothetical protein
MVYPGPAGDARIDPGKHWSFLMDFDVSAPAPAATDEQVAAWRANLGRAVGPRINAELASGEAAPVNLTVDGPLFVLPSIPLDPVADPPPPGFDVLLGRLTAATIALVGQAVRQGHRIN